MNKIFSPEQLILPLHARIKPPILIILGSPRLVAQIAGSLNSPVSVFQLDLFQSEQIKNSLNALGRTEDKIICQSDLWDLSPQYQTILFPIAAHGERELKIDMLEQAFHLLPKDGLLVSISEYESDELLPKWHKNLFGKFSSLPDHRNGSVYWSYKQKEKPRRRHELTFHARSKSGQSYSFCSRPGVFSYGELDNGTRALLDIVQVKPGDRLLDLGCGLGAAGILASEQIGKDAEIGFADSNLRALALTELNAKQFGLSNYQLYPTHDLKIIPRQRFDVILANPPYYANSSIAQKFMLTAIDLLSPKGAFYLVTKQINTLAPMIGELFSYCDIFQSRGYHIIRGSCQELLPEHYSSDPKFHPISL